MQYCLCDCKCARKFRRQQTLVCCRIGVRKHDPNSLYVPPWKGYPVLTLWLLWVNAQKNAQLRRGRISRIWWDSGECHIVAAILLRALARVRKSWASGIGHAPPSSSTIFLSFVAPRAWGGPLHALWLNRVPCRHEASLGMKILAYPPANKGPRGTLAPPFYHHQSSQWDIG